MQKQLILESNFRPSCVYFIRAQYHLKYKTYIKIPLNQRPVNNDLNYFHYLYPIDI